MDPFTMMALAGGGASLVGGLIGAGGAKKGAAAAEAGLRAGQAAFDGQADRAEGFVGQGYDKGLAYINPYVTGGRSGYDLYLSALGVNGADAQKKFYSGFQDDPGFAAALAQGQKQIEHSAIFGGRGDSGATMKDLYAYGENQRLGAYRDRLDRLSGLGQMGLQAGGMASNLEVGRGQSLADIALKRGTVGRDTAMGIGAARAKGITGAADAWGGALKGIGGAAMTYAGRTPTGTAPDTTTGPGGWRTTVTKPGFSLFG